ncbi:MAG: ribonuclease HI [Candidatus Tokpelaia sp. JSC188]|nr:MAG: ribonuclease HI [Candidatus Tokpelaia sp. JSC188]
MKQVTIYTDGACSGNPGPGGWGALLIWSGYECEIYDGEAEATNNRMELIAALNALNSLKEPCSIDLYTDSRYVHDGVLKWINGWERNGWRTVDRKPVKNMELWQQLKAAYARHKIRWHWVKGHAGHYENRRVDELARKGIEKVVQS